MSSEHSNHIQQEHQPEPGYHQLEAQLLAAREAQTAMNEEIADLEKTLDPATVELLDSLGDQYDTYRKTEDNKDDGVGMSDMEFFVKQGTGILPTPVIEVLSKFDALDKQEATLLAQLEPHVPEKTRDVREGLGNLLSRVDYDRAADIMTDYSNESFQAMRSQLHYAIAMDQYLRTGTAPDYDQISRIADEVAASEELWQEHGLLTTEAVDHSQEAPTMSLEELRADTAARIDTIRSVTYKYRPQNLAYDSELGQQLSDIARDSFAFSDPEPIPEGVSYPDAVSASYNAYNAPLLAAIERRTGRQWAAMDQNEVELDVYSQGHIELLRTARAIDVEAVLDDIEIFDSFAGLPFEFGRTELKQYLREQVPPLALQTIKRIEFRPMSPEEDKEDSVMGYYNSRDQTVVISDAKVKEYYDYFIEDSTEPQDIADYQQLAKERMLGILEHEMAHAFHDVAPIAVLLHWDKAREADPDTHVTPYVESRYKDVHPHRFMEDFADSTKVFGQDPMELFDKSPKRFLAAEQIRQWYLPGFDYKTHQHRQTLPTKWRKGAEIMRRIDETLAKQESES